MYLLDEMLLLLFEKIDLSKMTNFEIYQFFGRNFYLSIFDKKIFSQTEIWWSSSLFWWWPRLKRNINRALGNFWQMIL